METLWNEDIIICIILILHMEVKLHAQIHIFIKGLKAGLKPKKSGSTFLSWITFLSANSQLYSKTCFSRAQEKY